MKIGVKILLNLFLPLAILAKSDNKELQKAVTAVAIDVTATQINQRLANSSSSANSTQLGWVANSTASGICQQEFMLSYGLKGLAKPEFVPLALCPGVRSSCCEASDQLAFYRSFKLGGEARAIRSRLRGVSDIYTILLTSLNKVATAAHGVSWKNRHLRASNCGILSERIGAFDIAKLSPKIHDNLGRLQEFFRKSYGGFYCSLCDSNSHSFFNATSKNVTFSSGFCRQIVENTLPILLLFHVQMTKFLNLVSQFLVSCSFNGEYTPGLTPPPQALIPINEKLARELYDCRDNRNGKLWLENCLPICSQFKLTEFSTFFEPNAEQIREYIKFIETQLLAFYKAPKRLPTVLDIELPKPASAKSADKGKPEEKGKDKAKTPKAPNPAKGLRLLSERSLRSPFVFQHTPGNQTNFVGFNSTFAEKGINPFEQGEATIMSSEIFAQLYDTLGPVNYAGKAANDRKLTSVRNALAAFATALLLLVTS